MPITPDILYEDNHLVGVNKPAGVLSQGDGSKRESLLDAVREYIRVKYQKPGNVFIGLVHRLDLPVTGAMIFARTSKAARRLHQEFLHKRTRKFYLALVQDKGALKTGWQLLEGYTLRKGDRTEITASPVKDAQSAILKYLKIAMHRDYSLLLIQLETGRKHQIRAQLAHEGYPVLGDRRYGSHAETGNAIALHACFLRFRHPVRDENITLTAPLPEVFLQMFPGVNKLEKNIIDSIETAISG